MGLASYSACTVAKTVALQLLFVFMAYRFTTNVTPADISIDFLSGKGGLRNVELSTEVFTTVLQLPSWMKITRVVCDFVTASVPFVTLKRDPVHFVSVCEGEGGPTQIRLLLAGTRA